MYVFEQEETPYLAADAQANQFDVTALPDEAAQGSQAQKSTGAGSGWSMRTQKVSIAPDCLSKTDLIKHVDQS